MCYQITIGAKNGLEALEKKKKNQKKKKHLGLSLGPILNQT
jgi:hypothetical protein